MKKYEYDKSKFNENSIKLIEEMISSHVNEDIFKLATQINERDTPIFNYHEMKVIFLGFLADNLSIEQIKKYAIVHNGSSVYNYEQMLAIKNGMRDGLSDELINFYTKLGPDMKPVYDSARMSLMYKALSSGMSKENIETMTNLDDNGKIIFDWPQMEVILKGAISGLSNAQIKYLLKLNNENKPIFSLNVMKFIYHGFIMTMPLEYIETYARIKDEKLIFSFLESQHIFNHMKHAFETGNFNKMKQIKECIDEGLTYDKFEHFLFYNIPSENMRILRSFYKLGCTADHTTKIIRNDVSYQDLKDIKYSLQCTNACGIYAELVLDNCKLTDKEIKMSAINAICCAHPSDSSDMRNFIERCFSYKVPPEQISYLADPKLHFSYEEMKAAAIGFLNGLNIEEMKNIVNEYNELPFNDVRSFRALINDILKEKLLIGADINSDKEISFVTDYFNDIER